jgi:hypothetical protein
MKCRWVSRPRSRRPIQHRLDEGAHRTVGQRIVGHEVQDGDQHHGGGRGDVQPVVHGQVVEDALGFGEIGIDVRGLAVRVAGQQGARVDQHEAPVRRWYAVFRVVFDQDYRIKEKSGGEQVGCRSGEMMMRALLVAVGIVALVLILLGLFLKAVKWLIILGVIALVASIVLGVVQARRAVR